MSLRGLIVFHATPEVRQTNDADQLISDFNEGRYTPVAHLGAKFDLEDALSLTTNTDEEAYWAKKDGVRDIDIIVKKRSTSVGDVILDASSRRAYQVSDYGFVELNPESLNFDEQVGFAHNGIRKDQLRHSTLGRSMG